MFEHADGGHEWGAGYLDYAKYRSKAHVLRRECPSVDPKMEPFDGTTTHYMLLVDRLGQLFEWEAVKLPPRPLYRPIDTPT